MSRPTDEEIYIDELQAIRAAMKDKISLRDHFAGLAMQGLLTHYGNDGDDLSRLSYQMADAMLKERNEN